MWYNCSKRKDVVMDVNSVNSVAFKGKTATTKNGNEYNKVNGGKITGAVLGTGYGVYSITKAVKLGLLPKTKNLKGIIVPALTLLLTSSVGVGIGAIGDAIVNGIKRKNADKPVMLKETK